MAHGMGIENQAWTGQRWASDGRVNVLEINGNASLVVIYLCARNVQEPMTNCASDNVIVPIAAPEPQEGGIARRKRGRPRVVRPAPDHDEFEYLQAQGEARQRLIEGDSLLQALRRRADSADVIHEAVVGLAEESACLRFDREHADAAGLATAEVISSRRVDALGKLATTITQAKRMGVYGDIDIRGPQFEPVERFFVETIAEALLDTAPTEVGKLVLDRLISAMRAWRASLDSPTSSSP